VRLSQLALFVSAALTLAVGCGSNESESRQAGVSTAVERVATTGAAAEESGAILRASKKDWLERLNANARDDPAARFDNPTEDEFLAQVRMAADEYAFRIVEARWLEPLQAAPLVVVEAADPVKLARDTPAILRLLDPQAPVGENDWEGWAFEGFFFEARDTEGVPFLAVFNHWRGADRGGGEWARSEDLYPYEHG